MTLGEDSNIEVLNVSELLEDSGGGPCVPSTLLVSCALVTDKEWLLKMFFERPQIVSNLFFLISVS